MNAERDVERLVTRWLAEEAEVRAPDRVLESARRTIDRTLQRRWRAAWREPVTLTTTKLAALAAALVIALAGAAWIGRATMPEQGVPNGTASPNSSAIATPVPPAVTLESYQAVRDEICLRYRPQLNPLKKDMEGLYDPNLSKADRAPKIVALSTTADLVEALANELRAMAAPPALADEHRDDVANWDAIVVLARAALAKLEEEDVADAEGNDLATDVFSRRIDEYEAKYNFLACP